MTSRQRIYIHHFRTGKVRKILVNQSLHRPGRVYTQLEFRLTDLTDEERAEFASWACLVKEDLRALGLTF